LGNLLRSEKVREDYGISEVLQLAGSSQWVVRRADGDFSFGCKVLAEKCEGDLLIIGD
jgi:hypothetical protein